MAKDKSFGPAFGGHGGHFALCANAPAGFLLLALLFKPAAATAQTSWKGATSTDWNTAANWTAGVPTSGTDAIIGDGNFTGANQPALSASSACKSLTLGTGTKASTLTVGKALTVSGNIIIGTNGTLTHTKYTISLTGNWTNSGAYSYSGSTPTVTFSGGAQALSGTTAFRKLTLNAGSIVRLAASISVAGTLTVGGTLDPGDAPAFTISGAGRLTVSSGGKILIKASTFSGNYATTGNQTLSAGSTVEYAAAGNQTVDNSQSFSTLRISGGGVKTLAGNLPALNSSSATAGNIDAAAGTLDLSTFTAGRGTSVTGGTLSLASGATLRIGGTNSFPANYATHSLAAGSLVEYYGTNQTVSAESYGSLTFSSSGAATKSLPTNSMTIAGNLTSVTNAAGASVSFPAAAPVTISGSVTIGAGTTFNGSSFAHSVGGNWTNNGAFTGTAGSVTMSGAGASTTGAGANNFNDLIIAGAGITAGANVALNVAGNFSTSGAGTFTHLAGGAGTVTLSGAGKNISGTGISFNHLTVSGSQTTASSLAIAGNLAVSGSFSSTAGTITLSGAGYTVSGAGTIAFNALSIPGSITTTNSFSLASDLAVSGSFAATAGTATFNASSTLSGTANLFNVTLNGTRLQLGASAMLGVAGTFTQTVGTFDVMTTSPNTVSFNASAVQTVPAATYNNLTLAGSGAKTAGGALVVNRDLTIGSGTTFGAGAFTHSVSGNWINNGAFTAGTSTVQLLGGLNSSISGATTFNVLTLNKSNSVNVVTLNANVAAGTLNMTSGQINTATNTVTITSTRTGNGVILGTITRSHAFSTGVAYAFESPNNTFTFISLVSVSSVTVTAVSGPVADFPFGGAVNRQYTLGLTSPLCGCITRNPS